MLLLCGASNPAWAGKVIYHILTLPIDNDIYHMKEGVSGKRLEAVKVVVDNQFTVELPAHYKSPLATGFTYYKPDGITGHGSSAVSLYDDVDSRKGILYKVNGEDTPEDTSDDATPVLEGSAPYNNNTAEYYVVYTYNASNTIAKLDGSVNYNIGVKGKGFLSLNRGRNNRPAVIPTAKADAEMLASEDFSYVDKPGNNIATFWDNGKNKREDIESKFFFGFKFEGNDPYHIIVRTSYNRDITYIEKNEGTQDFVYKWYKGAALMTAGAGDKTNAYLASDDHVQYTTPYNSSIDNPTNPASITKTGYFHGNNCYWSTVALLNNTTNDGYVLLGTRTVNGNGDVPTPSGGKYNYVSFNGYNNINFITITGETATENHTIDVYPLKKVTFKIATPFYAADPSDDHIVSVADWVSQYTVENEDIVTKYLPTSLLRKYCTLTGFYSDAACTNEITRFSQADYDNTEGYKVYIGYKVDDGIPFKAITPAASYSASTWAGATWYELTDDGSTQTDGLKLKYDGTNFKNNGADGVYDKTTEFAFIGDPYELQVVYRNTTSGNTVQYVGAAGTPPPTETALTASTTASEGYKWELPNDATAGSFLLRKYKGTGNWYWNAGHPSPVAVSYSTKAHTYNVATANAQTVTFNVSDLGYTEGDYILVTAGGTDASQVTVSSEKFHVQSGGTASFTAAIKGRGDSNKTFTLTIQKYDSSDATDGTASVITVNQNSSTIVANTVEYNTESSTRVKVMTLPMRSFIYNIVDKSGRIAVKASATQTIFSPLSLASIPSIIVSPYLYGETITFYSAYSGGGRENLSSPITELTAGNAASSTNVYVKYTTAALNAKPINLSEDQELNVKLNGQYIYYDKEANVLKTNANPTTDELDSSSYLWKLRNRDPYAMLIDNMGARKDLSVFDTETVTVYDDDGGTTTPLRQKGAWVTLESIVNEGELTFTKRRSTESEGSGAIAQQFIAKASLQQGVYEVMVADGGSVDASTTYYDIACPEADVVKIFNNTTYAHGHDVLRFVLNQNVAYTYHLIDKAKHELLTADSKTPDLALPAEFQSPLVATYHFYASDQIDIDESKTPHEYTPTDPANKYITDFAGLNATYDDPVTCDNSSEYDGADASRKKTATDDTDMLEQAKQLPSTGYYYFNINNGASYKKINVTRAYQGTDIYVTYDANDVVTFNTAQYMLKFLTPYADGYYLEDGNDKLTSDKIQAVYPYCNGDGNLNIYGTHMQEEQFNGGSSTRPRWVWYFDSNNKDPYHVKIRSKSTISYKSINNPTYLTTYAVHFNQDTAQPKKQRIVTGGTLPGVASATPMEYMVLGSAGNYKLLTTERVAADLNGDGDTEDTVDGVSENARRNVTSFEQYWKTYNMIKLHVLGISKTTDEYSDDPATWVVPNTPLETTYDASSRYKVYNDAHDPDLNYRDFLYQQMGWHSYDAYANATRWNGYNDKTNGGGKKVVEKIEHWYQTFDMGTGTFDIESADIPPVLVLLDHHGWEIMRRPIPTTNYPEGEELVGLKEYDSPLVDRYYFYSNATKASGCHKYTLRLNDSGEERDQIKYNGVHWSSTSLGDLPPESATGVKDNSGAFNDQFVVYTVKEEYENNYSPSLDKTTSPYTESGISQPYLVLQNGRFYKAENTLAGNHDPSYLSKPIIEHTSPEGGNVYDLIVSPHNHGGTNNNIIDGSGNFLGNNFWYVKPNLNIDDEMGIPWVQATGEANETAAKNKLRLEYNEKNKSGFDPYNIQLQLVNDNAGNSDGRYLTTHMTSTRLHDGIMIGDYSGTGGTMNITLEAACTSPVSSEGYDHTNMQITNQTFMAVSDVNGNMQLMPRFDHTQRVDLEKASPWDTHLSEPKDHAKASVDNNDSMGAQTTFFVTPKRFQYHIIDNNGREALRYKRGADFYPTITDHFKSPLAKDFIYYSGLAESNSPAESTFGAWNGAEDAFKKSLTSEALLTDAVKLLPTAGTYYYRLGMMGSFTYKSVEVTKGLSEKEITGSFAAAKVTDVDNDVYVRYSYDEDVDHDGDKILLGPWFTVKLANKDLQAMGSEDEGYIVTTIGETQGTGVYLYADAATPTKPATIDASAKKWQWKFLQAPTDPSSDYYAEPDPYAVQIFNRAANYTTNPSAQPSPMAVGIKVPNANNGANRFALLSHPKGGYALVVAKTYSDYDYPFLNGASMTDPNAGTPVAATTVTESGFNYKAGTISDGAQLVLNDDVEHTFTYNVITNAGKLAITAEQDNNEAESHSFDPYLPESAQSPLLNMDDYLYYGFASRPNGDYSVIPQTKLYTLYGLYDDVVYVRYNAFSSDNTPYLVPNKKSTADSHVIRDAESNDVAIDISGKLPYNIIWYDDNMMASSDGSTVSDGGSKDLTGDSGYTWYFVGGDPYALNIKKAANQYINASATLSDTPQDFMLLRKDGYPYGVFAKTGAQTFMLSFGTLANPSGTHTLSIAAADPNKFIPFALSTHRLVYHLVINTSNQHTIIPYRTGDETTYNTSSTLAATDTLMVRGTTQRDLTSQTNGIAGDRYQLGHTYMGQTYCVDAGQVSIGDELTVPNEFARPNCVYFYYIDNIQTKGADTYKKTADDDSAYENARNALSSTGYYYFKIGTSTYTYKRVHVTATSPSLEYTEVACTEDDYDNCWQDNSGLNNRFKGLKVTKLMSASDLVGSVVNVNVAYGFNTGLETNAGDGFITEMKLAGTHYLWYTFETADATPKLAHYTYVGGMKAESGRALHYTNDYLWAPLGDPYGFKTYNRYIYKNNGLSDYVLTTDNIADGESVVMGKPGTGDYESENEIYELLESSTPGSGNFRVHPLLNTTNTIFLGLNNSNQLILSNAIPAKEWTYGLSEELLNPYYQGAGNVGGLNADGKTAYETAQSTHAANPAKLIRALQEICYNKDNIVNYAPGYYRLCNQPGASSLSPQRYASGYLHEIEKTAGESSTAIPMHFYSKKGVNGSFKGETNPLGTTGYTETAATRGDIPIPATEYDPSTIFYFSGDAAESPAIPISTIQTQGLYVEGVQTDANSGFAKMTDSSGSATSFKIADIGGAVVIIYKEDGTRHYLNYKQGDAAHIYDLHYYQNVEVDGSKWCMEPVSTQNLKVATNNGGDGYYYATFYAPFDVQLPADALDGTKTYNAYTCKTWDNAGLHPTAVPAATVNAVEVAEGKFVPANTPVILRVKDESGSVTLTLPTASPRLTPITTDLKGKYLEQLLALDAAHDVYTMGVPFTSEVSKDGDYNTTGDITAPLPEFATSGVGFYINATPYKEADPLQAQWQRNNRYVLHNKIYYRAGGGGARELDMDAPQFVPVIFDFDGEEEEGSIEEGLTPRMQGDNHVYDLSGRCVATPEQVADGSWWQNLSHGIYILNGKKIRK